MTYLLTMPTPAEAADMIAKLKDAIARVGRFAGEGRAAVSKTERDLAEQWSREGLDEEEINKLLNTVRGATSRMFEEALTTLKKGK